MANQILEYINNLLLKGKTGTSDLISNILYYYHKHKNSDYYQNGYLISIHLTQYKLEYDYNFGDDDNNTTEYFQQQSIADYLLFIQDDQVMILELYLNEKQVVSLELVKQLGNLPSWHDSKLLPKELVQSIFVQEADRDDVHICMEYACQINYDSFIKAIESYIQDGNSDKSWLLAKNRYKTTKRAI